MLDTSLNFENGEHEYLQSSQYWTRGVSRKSNSRSNIFILLIEAGRSKYYFRSIFYRGSQEILSTCKYLIGFSADYFLFPWCYTKVEKNNVK